ncbi:unnamed protein product [Scytosiphon promiscuus]
MSVPSVEEAQQYPVLIDTHCHVHVSLDPVSAGCCNSVSEISHTPTSSSVNITEEEAQQAGIANSGSEVRKTTPALSPLPEVVRITMGIREDDWVQAVRFGAPDPAVDTSLATPVAQGRTRPSEPGRTSHDARAPFYRFGLGLHPWSAHSRSESWLRDLTALLEQQPSALVGEIGLDKVARTPETRRVEWDDQVEVFESQMSLAANLRRPVSLHCVKAYGKVVDYLRGPGRRGPARSERASDTARSRAERGKEDDGAGSSGGGQTEGRRVSAGGVGAGPMIAAGPRAGGGSLEGKSGTLPEGKRQGAHEDESERAGGGMLPPRIALHSFTGSVEVARDLIRLRARDGEGGEVYFGFSAAVNMRGDREANRLGEVLKVLPDSRILIETDRRVATNGAAELLRVCGAIAQAKGVSIEEAAELANRNADRFLARVS